MFSRKVFAFFAVVLCIAVMQTDGAILHRKDRAVTDKKEAMELGSSESSTAKSVDMCLGSTPCGWAVYHRFTRDIDYFMKNKCECPDEKKCIRTDDDISVTAYVYRCKDPDNPKIDAENES